MDDQFSLLKRVLTKVFGVSAETATAAVSTIRNAEGTSVASNNAVQKRIGSRAHSFITSALRIANEQKKGQPDQQTNGKKDDKKDDKKDVKESFSFTNFLLNETMVDIDLSDPNAAQADIRQKARQAKSNPRRLAAQNQDQARQEKADARSKTGARAGIERQVADLKMKLATLQKRLASMPTTESDNSAFDMTIECCQLQHQLDVLPEQIIENDETFELVMVNEGGDVVEIEDFLSESAVRQYKRFGANLKIRYRCQTGQRSGKIVSEPSACAQRKDPIRVRNGRKVMRSKKGVISRKSRVSKQKAVSKTLSRMNKRLSGNN